jgi:hypothetical protein
MAPRKTNIAAPSMLDAAMMVMARCLRFTGSEVPATLLL